MMTVGLYQTVNQDMILCTRSCRSSPICRRSLKKSMNPGVFFSINKSKVHFKGCKLLKEYVPMKSIEKGFNVWIRADATTRLFCQSQVFTGKKVETGTSESVLWKSLWCCERLCFTIISHRFNWYMTLQWWNLYRRYSAPADNRSSWTGKKQEINEQWKPHI